METNKPSWLTPQWFQRGLNALREQMDPSPQAKRAAIEFLLDNGFWGKDGLTYESAESRYNNNLNPAKPTQFKSSEILAVGIYLGRRQYVDFQASEMSCEVRPIPTEERHQRLLEEVINSFARHNELLERVSGQMDIAKLAPYLRVHPAFIEGGAFAHGDGPAAY